MVFRIIYRSACLWWFQLVSLSLSGARARERCEGAKSSLPLGLELLKDLALGVVTNGADVDEAS